MTNVGILIENDPTLKAYARCPVGEPFKRLLVHAIKIHVRVGASTCVLVKFHDKKDGVISTVNLGNSAYLILRPSN